MITPEMIQEAKTRLVEVWGESGKAIIKECAKFPSLNMTSKTFLDYCYACGGNWGGMFLTGIKELRPAVWDIIPDDMGKFAFGSICYVLILCGVDTSI